MFRKCMFRKYMFRWFPCVCLCVHTSTLNPPPPPLFPLRYPLASATRVIVAKSGKTINFLL